ncbi:MAG: hypothetical protein NWE79_03680 [Candidatus Bathyarchaeota archaeon]|nr:hypothetical protein [Candidatus Bathyarchaeota archaeon]
MNYPDVENDIIEFKENNKNLEVYISTPNSKTSDVEKEGELIFTLTPVKSKGER